MAYRHKLRVVDEYKVISLADVWGGHIVCAVNSRDEHNACRAAAKNAWEQPDVNRLTRAHLSVDYAKQAFVPVVPAATTGDFFVQKQGLDLNMFAIHDEGSGKHTPMLTTEGARHDSNAVVSQIHYYLTHICPRAGSALELNLHMDSCIGQNKNNIMLAIACSVWLLVYKIRLY